MMTLLRTHPTEAIMGRDVKRVSMDFDWPLHDVWPGYLMPDSLDEAPCPAGDACLGGLTAARAWVGQLAQLALMLDDDLRAQQRSQSMHPYFDSVPHPYARQDCYGYGSGRSQPRPSPDISEFGAGLAGRAGGWLGHDACDRWRAEENLIKAAGLDPAEWGICPQCAGRGSVEAYPGQRAEAEAWEPTQPPSGTGWQLWETVSEGSPVSPVFSTAEDLAQWLTTPAGGDASGPSGQPMTIEQARGFVEAGWAPSGFITASGVHDGAAFMGAEAAVGDLFDQ